MNKQKPRGETDNCRDRLLRYCKGQGLDLGCGGVKIKLDAIGLDQHHPDADCRADARILKQYPDDLFDFVYSSHLLEEIQDTAPTVKEWLRVLKDDGYLVLYQADKDLYHKIGEPNCNPSHKHHFSWETLWKIIEPLGGVELVHHKRCDDTGEWSFELVIQKSSSGSKMKEEIEPEGISFMIPTRNRPQGMEDLVMTIDKMTKNHKNIEVVFGIGPSQDQASIDKVAELQAKSKIDVRYQMMNPEPDGKLNLAALWNQCYAVAKHPIVGYFGDDVLFKTPGWDEEVRKAFLKDKAILFSCNDIHVQRGKQATLFFTHKSVHDKVGYYLYPKFRRWYSDTMLDMAFRKIGKMQYHEEVVTEHLHPDAFPDRADEVYTSMEVLKEDDQILWRTPEIFQEVSRVAEIIKAVV